MLSQYKRGLDRNKQVMYLAMMIIEVNDFFNVKGNMNAKQTKLTAELILDNDNFYDLTLGNIKACFRQKMMSEKIYDRLDGNIIIGWLREFKSEMADICENASMGRERAKQREEVSGNAGAITHTAYLAMLEARANDGDKEAQQILDDYKQRAKIPTLEERHRKKVEFLKFKAQYDRNKKLKEDADKNTKAGGH